MIRSRHLASAAAEPRTTCSSSIRRRSCSPCLISASPCATSTTCWHACSTTACASSSCCAPTSTAGWPTCPPDRPRRECHRTRRDVERGGVATGDHRAGPARRPRRRAGAGDRSARRRPRTVRRSAVAVGGSPANLAEAPRSVIRPSRPIRSGGGVRGALDATAEDSPPRTARVRSRPKRGACSCGWRPAEGGAWAERPLLREEVVGGAAPLVTAATLETLAAGRIVTLSALTSNWCTTPCSSTGTGCVAGSRTGSTVTDLVERLGNAALGMESPVDSGRRTSSAGLWLEAALDWQADNPDDVTGLEREFIEDSGPCRARRPARRA